VAQAALTKIFRQQIAALRDAVYDLSAGKTESGFSKLDAFGAIHEVEDTVERLEAIAIQHLAAVKQRKSSLIVAPTHAECRAISEVVRDRQRKEGFLSGDEHTIRRLEKVNLTESQRRDAINYNLGHVGFTAERPADSRVASDGKWPDAEAAFGVSREQAEYQLACAIRQITTAARLKFSWREMDGAGLGTLVIPALFAISPARPGPFEP
jgi:hypothetical protein